MIGLEIPIVARLNEQYEELRVNIASVMEHDYYGSLVGGLFFAFVGLPHLGLTYTPFVLGMVNFLVAMWLFFYLRNTLSAKGRMYIQTASVVVLAVLVSGVFFAKPIIFFAEQARYKDQVIYEKQSKYQKLVITQWKNHYWLFINGSQQFSTLDEAMYHEPLVHPLMQLSPQRQNILVMGGGDGLAVREILKYEGVKNITLVDLDPAMTDLGKNHPILRDVNKDAMRHPKLKILNQDGYAFLANTKEYFDIIIIDLPDPRTIELGRLYSQEFYQMCYKQLRPNGLMITQSGSPYYSTRAFECIGRTINKAGFSVVQMHAQILTLGEWGWTIGAKSLEKEALKKALQKLDFKNVQTQWLNNEAMQMMTSFGKKSFFLADSAEINTIHNPVLPNYYIKGSWDLY
jgi:spermidine synthase